MSLLKKVLSIRTLYGIKTTVASPKEIVRVRQKKLPMLRWGWGNHRLFTASLSHWQELFPLGTRAFAAKSEYMWMMGSGVLLARLQSIR